MSTRALTYVFYNVHIRPGAKLVLLAIADTADDDGDNAWPSIATLARKASVHPRSVQRAINELVQLGLLTVVRGAGPPGTNYYRVHMPPLGEPTRPTAEGPPVAPRRRSRPGRARSRDGDASRSAGRDPGSESGQNYSGEASNLGDNSVDGRVDNSVGGVEKGVAQRHPGNLPGVTEQVEGGDRTPQRGDTRATRTSNRTQEHHPRARARASAPRTLPVDGGRRDDEGEHPELDARRVLTELGPGWKLSPRQVDALVPATQVALRCGWRVDELIAYLSARPDGVRSPVAVLTMRLRTAANSVGRSRSAGSREVRLPWCGDETCDPVTRIRDPGDDPRAPLYRCPVCHPMGSRT